MTNIKMTFAGMQIGTQLINATLTTKIIIFVFLITTGLALRCLYNLYLHPLSAFKGPRFLAASEGPLAYLQLRGTSHSTIKKAHEKYGSVVRISPSTLSFTDPSAWNDIYGYRKGGLAALPRDKLFYNEMLLEKTTISLAQGKAALPIRRSINAGFSHKSLIESESIVRKYLDQLMTHLDQKCKEQGSVDMHDWFTFCFFDVTSDFVFGEELGCMKIGKYNEWAQLVIDYFFVATFLHQCYKFWPLNRLLALTMPPSLQAAKERHSEASYAKVRRRMDRPHDRQDWMTHYLRQAEKEKLSLPVIEAQATIIILAGSETTAIALTGAVYYILKDDRIYQRLCDEIRSAFATKEEITMDVLVKAPFLERVVKEVLRLHPPVPNGMPRTVMDEAGHSISGHWVPPSTTVIINQYCASVSPDNFHNPELFYPDRWLPQSAKSDYARDRGGASQPFLVGPRDCPGKAFALNNIKLALALLIWNFDLQLADGMGNWLQGMKVYNGWRQTPLEVVLSRRKQQ